VVLASAAFFVVGCSSDDDTIALPDDGTDVPIVPGLPDVAPPPPTSTINGLWVGDFSRETTRESVSYNVSLLFNRVVAEDFSIRGDTVGVALGDGPLSKDALTEHPHFLFEGGFAFSTVSVTNTAEPDDTDLTAAEEIVCEVPNALYPSTDGGVWAIGRFGTRGTFLQEFAYDTGSAAGPDQRGAGCLYYAFDATTGVSKLTGEIQFEEDGAGKLVVDMTYSPENARSVSLATLGLVGSDGSADAEYHLWSNDNSGTSMAYTRETIDTTTMQAVEISDVAAACGGQLNVNQVDTLNLFTVNTIGAVSEDCNVFIDALLGVPIPDVALPFEGLGILADVNLDGVPEYWQLMKSTGSGAGVTAHALFNQFTITDAGSDFD
jgi:hypothetical protein